MMARFRRLSISFGGATYDSPSGDGGVTTTEGDDNDNALSAAMEEVKSDVLP